MQKPLKILSRSPEKTRLIGKIIGQAIDSKTMIALTGDLGAGKTVFVQGLASGLDVPEDYYVTSPTYTIINEYPGRIRLFHIDLYRITVANELFDIGFDEICSQNSVVVVEWADRLKAGDLSEDMAITIKVVDDLTREFCFFFYGRKKTNLLNHLKGKLTNT
jgi:tRNA threonylcarbamoyladenosine biosynthesis protein TsaE